MIRRKIILHGYLKKLWDGPVELVTETVAEAIEAFNKQTKAFEVLPGQRRHEVRVLGIENGRDLFEPNEMEEIHLVPSFTGEKGGFFKIVIGAVLVAVAVWNPAGWGFVGASIGATGATWGAVMLGTGIGLMMAGVLQLLAPQPRADTEESSAYLSGAQNTVKIGTRIPILYGEHQLYGHFLSYNVNAKDRIG